MQRINKISTIVLAFFLLYGAGAQDKDTYVKYADTLIVETEYGIPVGFAFSDISESGREITNALWGSVLNVMGTAIEASEKEGSVLVNYRMAPN